MEYKLSLPCLAGIRFANTMKIMVQKVPVFPDYTPALAPGIAGAQKILLRASVCNGLLAQLFEVLWLAMIFSFKPRR